MCENPHLRTHLASRKVPTIGSWHVSSFEADRRHVARFGHVPVVHKLI
jgi:hypothetical protein